MFEVRQGSRPPTDEEVEALAQKQQDILDKAMADPNATDVVKAAAVKIKKSIEQQLAEHKIKNKNTIFNSCAYIEGRDYDESIFRNYFKRALSILHAKNLTLAAEFFNIAKVLFINGTEIESASLLTHNKREIWFNANFLLDDVKIGHDLDPEDYISTKGKNMPRYKHGDFSNLGINRMAFLIAHELLHSIFQHSSTYYDGTMKNHGLKNAAMDVYINHFLHSMGFDVTLTEPYLTSDSEMMHWLSPVYQPEDPTDKMFKEKIVKLDAFVIDIYKFLDKKAKEEQKEKGEGEGGEGGEDGDGDGDLRDDNFLGSHGKHYDDSRKEQMKEKAQNGEPDSMGDLEGLLKELNKASNGRSSFGSMFDSQLLIDKQDNPMLIKALKASEILKGMTGEIKKAMKSYKKGLHAYSSLNPDPKTLTKAQRANMANGERDPFYRRFKGEVKTKAIIYLDVSGSIFYMVPQLYSIMAAAMDMFDLEIILFSTELHAITLKDIKAGNCKTTGGTDFDIWIQDLREKSEQKDSNYTSALVITDGFASVNSENTKWLQETKVKLNYLVVDNGRLPKELADTADHYWNLKM